MPVAHVSTVCMDPTTPQEYFNVGDKFLCFGMMMNNSLINPNQVRAFNIPVHDNSFKATVFKLRPTKPSPHSLSSGKLSYLNCESQRHGENITYQSF